MINKVFKRLKQTSFKNKEVFKDQPCCSFKNREYSRILIKDEKTKEVKD